jgi:hypothetical protein
MLVLDFGPKAFGPSLEQYLDELDTNNNYSSSDPAKGGGVEKQISELFQIRIF